MYEPSPLLTFSYERISIGGPEGADGAEGGLAGDDAGGLLGPIPPKALLGARGVCNPTQKKYLNKKMKQI